MVKKKLREYLVLKQNSMSVVEYQDRFKQLSHYSPNEVDSDAKQKVHFLGGLIGPLKYQLQNHIFSDHGDTIQHGTGIIEMQVPVSRAVQQFSPFVQPKVESSVLLGHF